MQIPANINELPDALEFIRTNLSAKKVPKKEIARTLLATEDVLVKRIETAKSNISIVISGLLGTVEIRLYAKGEEFNSSDIEKKLLMENTDSGDEETNAIIHQLMQKLYGNNFLIKHENGANKISLLIKKSPLRQLFFTISSLIAGAIAGFLLQKFTPDAVSTSLSQNIFSPIYVMFMNSLKMVVGPLVFFSIASSIADFGDIKTLGKIALKIIFAYFCTSFIAIGYLAAASVAKAEMGISKKIYSFSMPLGTTINLNGTCVTVMISLLFLSKIFGISVTGGLLLSMIIAIIMISVGSSIPGGALLGITLLLPQIGVPADAVSLIMEL